MGYFVLAASGVVSCGVITGLAGVQIVDHVSSAHVSGTVVLNVVVILLALINGMLWYCVYHIVLY